MELPKKCPICGTTNKKKFKCIREGKTFKVKCICGYEHR